MANPRKRRLQEIILQAKKFFQNLRWIILWPKLRWEYRALTKLIFYLTEKVAYSNFSSRWKGSYDL